jgi:Abnormal spindle-like microcephaly-assoc'd, ASPM-SPD-2-Hydin/CARDB
MRSPVRVLCLALLPFTLACGGGDSSPTGPSTTTPPAATRVIGVSGNLAFGDVAVGSSRDLSYTITNTGNATLTVTGTSVSGGLASQLTASWTNGTIAAGASQTVTVRFQPTTSGSYNGTVSVNGDQTSGSNSIAISANATGASAQGNWSGRYEVQRCDGTGSNQDYFCSNRGAYPPGSSLPIALNLTQSGTSVSGSITFGQVTGSVRGSIDNAGNLSLTGTASNGQINLALTSFNVSISGTSMSGNVTYGAGLAGIPGVAVVTSRLSGVTRR